MAAEVLAQGGARVTVFDRMPAAGRKFLLAGRGGLNLTHSEPLDAFLARYGAAMPHLRDAIAAFPPDKAARLVRRAGAGDLRRVERAGVPEEPEGVAAAARLAQAARCRGRRVQAAPSLDRLGRRRRADVRDAGGRRDRAGRCDRAGAWRCELAETWLRRKLGRDHDARRHRGRAAAARQCRRARQLVGRVPRSLRRRAAQAHCACRSADADRARRGAGHAHRARRRRHLCAVGRDPQRHRCRGRGRSCTSTCVPISRWMR